MENLAEEGKSETTALNRRYFERHQGIWHWRLSLEIKDWQAFLCEHWAWANKARLWSVYLSQSLLGGYRVRTEVRWRGADVFHRTRFGKWGFILYASEKIFVLAPEGQRLILSGQEYLWPNIHQGLPFAPLQGEVHSEEHATYAMPFMGLVCPCQTYLDGVRDEIVLENAWLRLVFRL